MSRQAFLKGALILTVAGIIVKIIGAGNRIFLSRLLGGEGIGLYQMAYPIYQMALSVSSAGIPVAISILVAEKMALQDIGGARRIFRISLNFTIATGLLFSLLLYFGAGWLVESQAVRDGRAYYSLVALAPAIFFVTVLASYRGFFQGMQKMMPTALSQIVEQLVRVVVMVVLAGFLLPYGMEYAAAGASFGAFPGSVAGVGVLVYFYFKEKRAKRGMIPFYAVEREPGRLIILRILKLALPVSLANMMLPLTANIDLLIVPARLEAAGYSVEAATELFGYLTGMAASLVNLPTILTASLAASLVPAISEALARSDKALIKRRASMAFRLVGLLMVPSCVGLYLLAYPVSGMLYATYQAGSSIAILSVGVVLLGVGQVTTGILQGMGYTAIPLVNMVLAAVAKTLCSWYLTALPAWGIGGAAWATNVDFGVAALLNLYFVNKYVGVKLPMGDMAKIVFSAAAMGAAVLLVYDAMMRNLFGNCPATLTAIFFGGIVYTIAVLFTGALRRRDIEGIPKIGAAMAKILSLLGLMKG